MQQFCPWRPWLSAILVLCTIFLLSGCEYQGADAEITRKLESRGKSQGGVFPDREDYYGVFVLDEQNAWVVGSRGIILHVTDPGNKVAPLSSGVQDALYDVDFADANHGLVIGRNGLILKTDDGGKTWKRIPIELPLEDWQAAQPHIFAMSRGGDPNKIWAVGPVGTIIHSQNGGETWENLSLGRDVTLNGVSFASDTEGWVVGEFGTILKTTDGGKTWEEQTNVLNLPKYTRPELSEEEALQQRVPPLYLEDLFLVAVDFRNPLEGYIAGESGILLQTDNGGEMWTNVSSGSFNTLLSITLASNNEHRDVATGVLGTLAMRQNGSWVLQSDIRDHVLTWIRDVSFARNGNFGLACGGKGTILVTHDGGGTWRSIERKILEQAAAHYDASA